VEGEEGEKVVENIKSRFPPKRDFSLFISQNSASFKPNASKLRESKHLYEIMHSCKFGVFMLRFNFLVHFLYMYIVHLYMYKTPLYKALYDTIDNATATMPNVENTAFGLPRH